jgi:hypothetical protein
MPPESEMPADAGMDPNAAPEEPSSPEAAPQPAPAQPAGVTEVASAQPMEAWRGDPFLPIGYKPPPKSAVQPKPRIADFPFMKLPVSLPAGGEKAKKIEKPEIVQPSRRMAGILLDDRVYAIIETNGVSQVVQPGDYTTDRLALVERIEPDKVVLKTVDEKPRYITVKMAASPISQSQDDMSAPPIPSRPGMPRAPAPGGAGGRPDIWPPL